MKIDILTLFPECFLRWSTQSLERLEKKGLLDIQYHNFREYAEKARHVDDEPYGRRSGNVAPWPTYFRCFWCHWKETIPDVILLDPAGKQFNQAYAEDFAKEENWSLSVVTTKGMTSASGPW